MIAALLAALLLVVAGWPIAALLDTDRVPLTRRLGESILLGAGMAAALLFLAALGGVPWSRGMIVGALLAISIVAALAARTRLGVTIAPRFGVATLLDVITLAAVAGYARLATIAPTPEYDFIGIWGVKAKEFLLAGGIDWLFLENPFNDFAHVDYPQLVPLLFDYHALIAGAWPDRWLGIMNVLFGIATLLIVRNFLAEEPMPQLLRAVATMAIIAGALSPWIGLAEGPLVAYGTVGVLFVRRALRGDSPRDVTRGAIYLGLAASCKNEGLTLIIAVAAGLVVTGAWRLVLRLWPAVVINLPWLVIRSMLHLQNDLTVPGVSTRVAGHLANLGPMFAAMARDPLGRPLFWIGSTLALILGVRVLARRERFLATAILVQFLVFIAAYIITPREINWHVHWSWERIVNQLTVMIAFLAFAVIAEAVGDDVGGVRDRSSVSS